MSTPIANAAEAERRANQIREDLAATLDQLRSNLRPGRLAREALDSTKRRTPDWIGETIAFVRSPSGLALLLAAGGAVATTLTARRGRT